MTSAGEAPYYWSQAKEEISQRDPLLAEVINKKSEGFLQSRGDLFGTLMRSIVGQQISTKAAATVWQRFTEKVVDVEPEVVLSFEFDELRSCGLSQRKTEYIIGISEAWLEGYSEYNWDEMRDDEIIEKLVALRGIGIWTAQMILIFTLLRPDVFPIDDLGVIRGMEKTYNQGESLERIRLKEIAETWKPWRSVASWYMWRAIDPELTEY